MKKIGRPSKLNAKSKERLLEALRVGNFREVAAEYAGIGTTTFYRWMEKGESEEKGEYRDFREAVIAVETQTEVRLTNLLMAEMVEKKNFKDIITFLEKRHRKRWGIKSQLELSGNKEKPLRVEIESIKDILDTVDDDGLKNLKEYAEEE